MSTLHALGTFIVESKPEAPYDTAPGASIGRVALSKRFEGALEATSTAVMIGARSEVEGSAGYVAIERVTGKLSGRAGSFVLQHNGTMTRGKMELRVSVIPDTGTGELKNLSGTMTIDIRDGQHFYDFEYTLKPSA